MRNITRVYIAMIIYIYIHDINNQGAALIFAYE